MNQTCEYDRRLKEFFFFYIRPYLTKMTDGKLLHILCPLLKDIQ